MRALTMIAVLGLAGMILSGCAVVNAGGAVIGAGASVVGAAADVTGAAVGAVTGSDSDDKKND
jgi:hypothetical protein